MPPMNLGATTVTGPVLGLAGQLVLLAALAAGVGVTPIGWLAGAGYAAVSAGALAVGLRRTRAARLGAANAVTLVRSSLVVGVTALVAGATAGGLPGDALVALTALAFVALVLDGVDGQVARRTGTSSALGARFDMEVDAFLILVLSIAVARTAGWWVLAIGALRYAFVAASWALPWLKASLPPRFGRKVVAAMQGIVLAVAASGLVWEPLAVASVAAALAVLLWSFGRDVVWLWATRGQVGADVVAAPTPAPAPA
ncbi:MAG TPA: CDP-alcohol phosphatidyltransferase family protein, partial [Micromonosporaceae bacterium]|nr:CDP-alcohol phosphatidyltransferase family protein [Micromonosporaceae bacterium]